MKLENALYIFTVPEMESIHNRRTKNGISLSFHTHFKSIL